MRSLLAGSGRESLEPALFFADGPAVTPSPIGVEDEDKDSDMEGKAIPQFDSTDEVEVRAARESGDVEMEDKLEVESTEEVESIDAVDNAAAAVQVDMMDEERTRLGGAEAAVASTVDGEKKGLEDFEDGAVHGGIEFEGQGRGSGQVKDLVKREDQIKDMFAKLLEEEARISDMSGKLREQEAQMEKDTFDRENGMKKRLYERATELETNLVKRAKELEHQLGKKFAGQEAKMEEMSEELRTQEVEMKAMLEKLRDQIEDEFVEQTKKAKEDVEVRLKNAGEMQVGK
jgi:hypothetical protein